MKKQISSLPVFILAGLALMAASCSKLQTGVNPPSVSQTATSQQASQVVSAGEAGITVVTVVGKNFSFTPSEIKVKKGDKVRVVFQNSDGFHDFVIDEFSARTKTVKSGESDAVEFTAGKTGSFEFYCSVGKHRQMGMKGTLVVE